MKHCTRLLNLLTFATLLLAATPLLAQEKPKPERAVRVDPTQASTMDAWQRRVPELNADNFPLGEVVISLRTLFPEINFIVTQNAEEIPVRIFLRSVTLSEILKAFELASAGRIQVANHEDRLIVFNKAASQSGTPPVLCRVFNLSHYLEGLSEKEADLALKNLHEALELAWSMLKKSSDESQMPGPQLNLHKSTRLLIAVGRPEELEVVQQVVIQLQESAAGRMMRAPAERERESRKKPAAPDAPSPSSDK